MWVRPVPEVIQDPPPSPQVYGDGLRPVPEVIRDPSPVPAGVQGTISLPTVPLV